MKGLDAQIPTQTTRALSDGRFWIFLVYYPGGQKKNWTLFEALPSFLHFLIDIFQCLIAHRKCLDALSSMQKKHIILYENLRKNLERKKLEKYILNIKDLN